MRIARRHFLGGAAGLTAFGPLAVRAAAVGPLAPLADHIARGPVPDTAPWASPRAEAAGLRALHFAGAPWRGQPSRVMAIMGMPANARGPVPGVVLAHGGGGTAFAEWVRRWNAAGFAAIAPALEGQTDEPATGGAQGERWMRLPGGGPARSGIYGDSAAPITDQWMFHAQWAVAAAHRLLAAQPGVDPRRIGLCGISWGGVITATAMGLDPRIAFAIPIYGAGFLSQMRNQYRVTATNTIYRGIWEPGLRLSRARMPSLWITGLKERHFSLVQQARSYGALAGPHMVSIQPDMAHNHPAGWTPPDSYAFARAVAIDGKGLWARQLSARHADGRAEIRFASDRPLSDAALWWTRDTGHTAGRCWTSAPATLHTAESGVFVAGTVPDDATAWFALARAGDLILTSDLQMNEAA